MSTAPRHPASESAGLTPESRDPSPEPGRWERWILRIGFGVYILAAVGVISYAVTFKQIGWSWVELRPFVVGILVVGIVLYLLSFGRNVLRTSSVSKRTQGIFVAIILAIFLSVLAVAALWLIVFILRDTGIISIRGKIDEEKAGVIKRFYAYIDQGDFSSAWDCLHSGRQKQLHDQGITDGPEHLKSVYATTVGHSNLRIDHLEGGLTDATFMVSFDVEDAFPRNDLFYSYQNNVIDMTETTMAKEELLRKAMANIRRYFEITEESDIRAHIGQQKVGFLFHPEFVSEVAREKGLKRRADYGKLQKSYVDRHFVLEIKVAKDGPSWRILGGLYPPKGISITHTKL
jgi:hypothetical protein